MVLREKGMEQAALRLGGKVPVFAPVIDALAPGYAGHPMRGAEDNPTRLQDAVKGGDGLVDLEDHLQRLRDDDAVEGVVRNVRRIVRSATMVACGLPSTLVQDIDLRDLVAPELLDVGRSPISRQRPFTSGAVFLKEFFDVVAFDRQKVAVLAEDRTNRRKTTQPPEIDAAHGTDWSL